MAKTCNLKIKQSLVDCSGEPWADTARSTNDEGRNAAAGVCRQALPRFNIISS
jgi:hypothetical protein